MLISKSHDHQTQQITDIVISNRLKGKQFTLSELCSNKTRRNFTKQEVKAESCGAKCSKFTAHYVRIIYNELQS